MMFEEDKVAAEGEAAEETKTDDGGDTSSEDSGTADEAEKPADGEDKPADE